jgi:DUF1009 family protein
MIIMHYHHHHIYIYLGFYTGNGRTPVRFPYKYDQSNNDVYTYLLFETNRHVCIYVFIGLYTGNGSIPISFPYKYDQSNNNSICNAMPAVVKVSDALEPYVYGDKGETLCKYTHIYIYIHIR